MLRGGYHGAVRFSLGVDYWPRRSAFAMWRDFDAGEIAEDVARIAALGLDTVRIFLRWDDFQPVPERLDPVMLLRLEAVVATAHDAGLGVVPVLCSGHLAGANSVPAWASGARDLYGGALLDAQLVFARAVGERLREHPALRVWDIGHAFSTLSQPSRARASSGDHTRSLVSEARTAEWSRRVTAALRESSSIGTTAGTCAADLTADRGIRLRSLCAPFAFASMQGLGPQLTFARDRLDADAVPFLAMLAAMFSQQAVMVTGFGAVTCRPDTFSVDFPCLSEDETARWCAAVLERLHRDGRLGAYWWCWADATPLLRESAPFATAPEQGAFGLIRGDGTEKPVAAALAAFARQQRDVLAARDMPAISADYYYRTLPRSTVTLYQAYVAFAGERG